MTRPGLRRSIPHGFVALALCAAALVSVFSSRPDAVVADTSGGQSSSYTLAARDVNNCVLWSPMFSNNANGVTSTLSLLHDAASATVVTVRVTRLGATTLVTRTISMAAHEMTVLSPSDLSVPDGFAGAIEVRVEGGVSGTLTPTTTPTRTAIPASTLIPTAVPPTVTLAAGGFTTPVPTATPVSTNTPIPTPTISLTLTTPASCGLTGVIFHDGSGDRSTVEMFRAGDPQEDFFIPAAHNNDSGFNSTIVIQNTDRNADQTPKLTFRPDSGAASVDKVVNIPAGSAAMVDMTGVPQGANTVEIDGPTGSKIVATVYHTGPGGMAAAVNGFGRGTTDIALPLLFRRAGNENAYSSLVRVMKIRAGGVTPKIIFWDRDTGAQIGPITAQRSGSDVVLREDEGFTWDLTQISQLQDGKIYSARVYSDERQEIGAGAGHLNVGRGTLAGYSGTGEGATTDRVFIAPYVVKGTDNLNSGIQLRNFGGADASVTIRFLNQFGNMVDTESLTVASLNSATVYLPVLADLPNGVYTAEITSSGALSVVVNIVRYR
jgi:hypothetical protein